MSQLYQFKLPDVGEGLTEADILRWDVKPGDVVTVNQTLVEVETAKAAVELPSPYAGVVRALHVEEGQTVAVGTAIISIEMSAEEGPGLAVGVAADSADSIGGQGVGTAPVREPVLVGYGLSARGSRRRRPSAQPAFDPPGPRVGAPAAVPTSAPEPTAAPPSGELDPSTPGEDEPLGSARVLAKPPVRQLAKQLGVDLRAVVPTGPQGSVSREDVQDAATAATARTAAAIAAARTPAAAPADRRVERLPVRGVRKHTAAAMVASAFTAPHVTEFVSVDVSATMELRDRVAGRAEFAGVKVSPLLFVARALLLAIPRTPTINASWEEGHDGATILVKHYVNLGIAAATERGLVVPTIVDADRMSLRELAVAISELTATARAGRTAPTALSGGTITITNVGVFGIDTGTPIINPGESAILAVGAVRRVPWVVERNGAEAIEARWVLQLALSFDHRLVDGAQGSRFLAEVADVLRDPGLAVLAPLRS